MRRHQLLSSCLALGAPAAFGALLVSSTLAPIVSPSATNFSPTPLAKTINVPSGRTSDQPVVSIRSTGATNPTIDPASTAPEIPSRIGPPAPSAGLPPGLGPPSPLEAISPLAPSIAPAPPAAPAAAGPTNDIGDARFAQAERLLQDDEFAAAIALLQQIRLSSSRSVAARAQFLIGRADLLNHDDTAGVVAFRTYLSDYPTGPDAPRARFALAAALDATGRAAEAVPLYQQYLAQTADHSLDGYAWLAVARDQDARHDQSAASSYRRAVQAGLPLTDELDAAARVAGALVQSGRSADAVSWYAGLADQYRADDPVRARYLIRAADTAARSGRANAAADFVGKLASSSAVTAVAAGDLTKLRSLGVSLDDITLGQAFLAAGNNAEAVSAFGDYLDQNPSGADAATARLGRGRALLGAGNDASAVAQLQRFLDLHPTDPRVGDARVLLAQAEAALATQSGDTASRTSTQSGPRDAFAQGWNAYEALDFGAARQAWETVRQRWPSDPGSPAALLWLAKSELRSGDSSRALQDLLLAWNANPGGYYAFRARELASTLNAGATGKIPPSNDRPREQAEFENWLALWTHTPADAARRTYLDAPIARTTTLARLRALASVGLSDDIDREYQDAIDLYWSDPRSLYALSDVLSKIGRDARSMKVAYRLLMMSPAPNAFQSPAFLQRLVYPFPYRDLVEASAQKYGVDPLLLVALMRQESSFDPAAGSSAGARGLTQFLPSTAALLAPSIGLSSFSDADLNRPAVAIKLGARYLADLTREFGGNPYVAVAAYNAGSGNVHGWLGDNPRDDFDLLAEEIPYKETHDYVRNVYRFYQEYVWLYRVFIDTRASVAYRCGEIPIWGSVREADHEHRPRRRGNAPGRPPR